MKAVATALELLPAFVNIISHAAETNSVVFRRRKTVTEWAVVYEIAVENNTKTYVENLLEYVSNDYVLLMMRDEMNEDVSGGTISKVESISIKSEYLDFPSETSSKALDTTMIVVISCVCALLFVCVIAVIVRLCVCDEKEEEDQDNERSQLVS